MENTTEKTEKAAPYDRVAHCLNCSNEWTARTGNEKKPARCPDCKSRRVKWRDLCTDGELEAGRIGRIKTVKPEETPEELPPEDVETPAEKVELPEVKEELPEETEEPPKEYPQFKKDLSKLPQGKPRGNKSDDVTLEEIRQDMKGHIGGLPLILVIGLIAGAGLFLLFFRVGKKRSGYSMAEMQNIQAEQERQRRVNAEQTLRMRLTNGVVF